MKPLFLLSIFVFFTAAQLFGRIQCPKISCNNELADDVCYRVLGDHPFGEIAISQCKDEYVCDFEDAAWVDSDTHFYTAGWKWNSTFYQKRKEARCHHYHDMRQ